MEGEQKDEETSIHEQTSATGSSLIQQQSSVHVLQLMFYDAIRVAKDKKVNYLGLMMN